MYKNIIALSAGIFLLATLKLNAASNVIYGEDDRIDMYQVEDPALKDIARSTLALVRGSKLEEHKDYFLLKSEEFGLAYGLCLGERFEKQGIAAFCSASLIGPDLVLTAGHCIRTCGSEKFVFDFAINQEGDNPDIISKNSVYSCKEIVARELENTKDGLDYAIVRLDREVNDRMPLSLRTKGKPSNGTNIFVIGHPTGLPKKLAAGAKVREYGPSNRPYFTANLDTYGGNSGSAVFNARTNEIEGVLVRGERDFVFENSCRVSNRCEDGECMGEHVTKISTILSRL